MMAHDVETLELDGGGGPNTVMGAYVSRADGCPPPGEGS